MDSVPYQAYKSKRHSRTLSSQLGSSPLSTSPPSRPASSASFAPPPKELLNGKPLNDGVIQRPRALSAVETTRTPPPVEPSSPMSTASGLSPQASSISLTSSTNGASSESFPVAGSSIIAPVPKPAPVPRKTSTFRRIPLREVRPSIPSSPLRSSHLQPTSAPSPTKSPLRLENELPALTIESPVSATQSPVEPIRSPSPPPPKPPPKTHLSDIPTPRTLSPQSRPASAPPAPRPSTRFYRPGFQPKGVYRPRTDQFVEARKAKRDSGRIETTRLERRLEKLINLHFSDPPEKPIQPPLMRERRASSFFEMDFSELRNKSAGELWKGVLQSHAPGGKGDVRASEQKITPWQEDSSVSQCPHCLASFHPITNRKHHCRLCGRIVCSLPVKLPQRPVTCSLLFVADSKTGKIEEVGEGVDYGVRRRTVSQSQGPVSRGKPPQLGDDEKFLKGVRICRECKPVLLRQQYIQEATSTPVFFKLYELFIGVEKEIEDALPQFQELILSLKNEEQPTAEASAARKRLLEAFAQYDTLAKRIRKLHCPTGPGSSQDRIQTAILTRANIFLQKNMFPLQSLPKPAKRSTSGSSTPSQVPLLETSIDPDSELAHALQPLLEQEALLETFVQEAKSHRKFDDAQILKANLLEIRSEIDRIVANADRGRKSDSKGKHRQ